METYIAHQEYLLYAEAQQNYYETVLWVMFTFFVIAPIGMTIIYLSVAYYLHRKNRL